MEWSLVGLAAVITALVGVCKFFDDRAARSNGKMLEEMDKKLCELDEKFTNWQTDDRLAITRLELMMLIAHDTENVVEIEKLADKYSRELGGNTYISSVVSKWKTGKLKGCAAGCL